MRLLADSGLWAIGAPPAPTPLTAVLEVSGAVLSWTVDDPAGPAATQITFTDVAHADWLWRVVGESGHVALAEAAHGRPADTPQTIELAGVDLVPGSVAPLRRLAIGHWLRRWWPASRRDGIPGLDRALLDAQIAVLTAAAQDFFIEDTLDSDVAELLAPRAGALTALAGGGDRRIVDLARACADLADEVGVGSSGWSDLAAALDDPTAVQLHAPIPRSQDDYALAAGRDVGAPTAAVIAEGVASIPWAGVPPAIFDAAEDTVDWSIRPAGSSVVAAIRAATLGPGSPAGVAARLTSGAVRGAGVLDAAGSAIVALRDADGPMTETAAWNHDWSDTSVTVGADVEESRHTRDRLRRFARARLQNPPDDAFLAELVAAESDY
jgi:hypothetical protein